MNVVIVGAATKGASMLRALSEISGVRVVGVADIDPTASGLEEAARLGVRTVGDFRELLRAPGDPVDVVIVATDQPNVRRDLKRELARRRLTRVVVVDPAAVRLVISLVERQQALVDQMRGLNHELEVILDSMHDGLVAVNSDGRITLFNKAAQRITGRSPEEALGLPVSQALPGSRLDVVLATREAELNKEETVAGVNVVANRAPIFVKNGEATGAVSVFRDLTEVYALAEQVTNLREMRSLLEAIISSTQDAISVVDEHGLGIMINPAYTRLTGLTEEDVLGQPATIDIAEGESMHMKVLGTGYPVKGARMKVGPKRKDVIVDVAPIVVAEKLKGSVAVIHDTSEIRRLTEELDRARSLIRRLEAKYTFDDIVGKSRSISAAVEQARRVAETPATVLLRGESGTGKELFAHAIHNASRRKDLPFIRVNCTAIADTLLESELFGYQEGAFTGAKRGGKKGLFEEADGGTMFLDEVGGMAMHLQAKLLRVLQEKEIVRVGDTRPIPVDVRVIAATNVDLEGAVRQGRMREDLYYRLNVVPVSIPPLRERKEDVPQLVNYLIRKFNSEFGRNVHGVSPEALKLLLAYPWPGNVRELENVVGRAMISMQYTDAVILPEHLPALAAGPDLPPQGGRQASGSPGEPQGLRDSVSLAERDAIQSALAACGGNRSDAARMLGISLRSLYYRLNRYSLS